MKHKKDTSPQVHQRDKLKNKLNIKSLQWTPRQKELIELGLNKDTRIVFVSGPAGTTKTILAVFIALELINQRKVSDIVYLRAAVESADSKLGYLPGEVDNKMAYYGIPFLDKLEELLDANEIKILHNEKRISVQPINYVRGQSWNTKIAIVDEAQNMTQKEIFTVLTRIGKFSKCFVLADEMQSDINGKSGGFMRLANHFADADGNARGIYHFKFGKEDILRDEITRFLVERYEELMAQQVTGKS